MRDVAGFERRGAMVQAEQAGDLGAEAEIVGARGAVGECRRLRGSDADDRTDAAGVVPAAQGKAGLPQATRHGSIHQAGEVLRPLVEIAVGLGLEPVTPPPMRLGAARLYGHRGGSVQKRDAFERTVAR